MNSFAWKDEYSINDATNDEQHKQLIGIVNRFQDAITDGNEEQVADDILAELIEYTKRHFHDEEALMQKINYSGYEEHCLLHQNLLEEIASVLYQKESDKEFDSFGLLLFLKQWLIEHIAVDDNKIKSAVDKYQAEAASV